MQTILSNTRNDIMFYNNIPVLKYNILYPVFTSTCSQTATKTINDIYAAFAKTKEDYCKTVLYPHAAEAARYIQVNIPPFRFHEFNLTYRITLNSGCITSLYLEQYTYTGGTHGSTLRTSDTWDFATGKRIRLKDFYAKDPLFQEKILLEIQEQVTELLKASPSSFFEDYSKRIPDTFHPDNFYLLPTGIVIYFQQYDIAPYATGLPEFSLPPL